MASIKTVTNDQDFMNVLQNPASKLQPGDIVYIFPGTYRQVTFRLSSTFVNTGSFQDFITITAADPTNRPRIQPDIALAGRVTELVGVSYILLDGLIFDGSSGQTDASGTPKRVLNDALKLTNSSTSAGSTQNIIRNCELAWSATQGILLTGESDYNQFLNLSIHDNGTTPGEDHGVYITTSYNVFDHCAIFRNLGIGIQVWSERPEIVATHNIIRNCIVHHNGTSPRKEPGILVLANLDPNDPPISDPEHVANTQVYNNIVHNNSQGGIWIGGTTGTPGRATDMEVYNNTVFHNRGADVPGIYRDPNSTNIDVQNNISYNNEAGDYSSSVDLSKNWPSASKPPFVDITNPDAPNLHLTAHTSPPAASLHLGEVISDADGICRPSGPYDMGAYEFVSPAGSSPRCVTWR